MKLCIGLLFGLVFFAPYLAVAGNPPSGKPDHITLYAGNTLASAVGVAYGSGVTFAWNNGGYYLEGGSGSDVFQITGSGSPVGGYALQSGDGTYLAVLDSNFMPTSGAVFSHNLTKAQSSSTTPGLASASLGGHKWVPAGGYAKKPIAVPHSPVDLGAAVKNLFAKSGPGMVKIVAIILAFSGIRMLVKWARGGYRRPESPAEREFNRGFARRHRAWAWRQYDEGGFDVDTLKRELAREVR